MKNLNRWFNSFLVLNLFLTACAGSQIGATTKPTSPTQTVKAYVQFARDGKIEEFKKLTTRDDVNAKAGSASADAPAKATDSVMVGEDPKVGRDARLTWVNEEFPKTILDGKLSVTSVRKETIDGDTAKVEAVIESADRPNVLGWVFLLSKGADGKWKIYDITTPGGVKE